MKRRLVRSTQVCMAGQWGNTNDEEREWEGEMRTM